MPVLGSVGIKNASPAQQVPMVVVDDVPTIDVNRHFHLSKRDIDLDGDLEHVWGPTKRAFTETIHGKQPIKERALDLDNYGTYKALQDIIRSLGWTQLYKKPDEGILLVKAPTLPDPKLIYTELICSRLIPATHISHIILDITIQLFATIEQRKVDPG